MDLFQYIGDITSAIVFLIIVLALILARRYGVLGFFQKNGNGDVKKSLEELKSNHIHELNDKLDRAERQHDKQVELLTEMVLILRDLKNK